MEELLNELAALLKKHNATIVTSDPEVSIKKGNNIVKLL